MMTHLNTHRVSPNTAGPSCTTLTVPFDGIDAVVRNTLCDAITSGDGDNDSVTVSENRYRRRGVNDCGPMYSVNESKTASADTVTFVTSTNISEAFAAAMVHRQCRPVNDVTALTFTPLTVTALTSETAVDTGSEAFSTDA